MNIFFFVLCLVISQVSYNVYGIQDRLKEEVKFESKSKLTIKSPINTIHTKFGDIIDCIDIYKQQVFNHPLLKNHKLQLKPNFQIEKTSVNDSQIAFMFGLDEEKCQTGTVPIQRTKNNSIEEKILLNDHILLQDIPGVHLAEVSLGKRFGPYYKVSGITSTYNPQTVTKNQISMSHVWVEKGPIQSTNKISAGWHVYPELYGDGGTHFYSSWTSDNYKKTGCYNARCRGFVQVASGFYLGRRFSHVSVYGGPTYESLIAIIQDSVTKHWWITLGNINIGYYPATLFSNLGSAEVVGWGGRTKTNVRSPSPPMGSGYFPDGNSSHACYFRSAVIQDASGRTYGPKPYQTESFTDKTDCFGVKYFGYQGAFFGSVLQFGGPGGNCGN